MTRDDLLTRALPAALLLLLLSPPVLGAEAVSDRVVARVGPEAITAREVEEMVRQAELSRENVPNPSQPALDRGRALGLLVERALVGLYAKEKGLAVTPAEVEKALEDVIPRVNGVPMAKEDFLLGVESTGFTAAEFRAQLAANLLAYKALRAALADRVTVTDTELENRWREEYPGASRLTLSHLFLALPEGASPAEEAARMAEARELGEKIRSGALPFAEAVRARSEDPSSASSGGSLGTFGPGELDPALEKAAAALKAGEVSAPVRGPDGIHLLRLDAREEQPPPPLASVREELGERIRSEKGRKAQEEWLKELRERYLVEVFGE